jgi:hypothetical protein
MARIKILGRKNVNNSTRKIPYGRMPIGIRIIKLFKELLFIVH